MIEALGEKIRQNENIEGIPIGSKEKKAAQYADDLWIAMLHKEKCCKALFNSLDEFYRFSGLRVNYDKTEILRIGAMRGSNAKYYCDLPLQWSDKIKILGLVCIADDRKMAEINFKETVAKARNILNIWAKCSLSLIGKILVINTLIVPLFTHRLLVTRSPTKALLEEYKKMIVEFIWESKRSKIAYYRLIRNFEGGGLKLVDLGTKDISLKIKWVQVSRLKEKTLWDSMLDTIFLVKSKILWNVI